MASIAEEQKRIAEGTKATNGQPPSVEYLQWFLANVDTKSPTSATHRLGNEETDAAQGDHKHNGRDSRYIFPGESITGDLATVAGNTQALRKVIELLTRIGAVDNTTN